MTQGYNKFHWTEHVKLKMRQYGLSKSKIMALLRKPERVEQGIAEGTMAAMQTNKTFFNFKKVISMKEAAGWQKKTPGEIWVMYRDAKGFRNVISAWRYPGVSKPGDSIPIPDDIRKALESFEEKLLEDE